MKLLKKLLPVASVAAVATTIAPMVTSCGAQLADLAKYESKIKRHDAVKLTTDQAADEYFGAKNAAEIIKDDIMVYLSTQAGIITDQWDSDAFKALRYLVGIEWCGKPKNCYGKVENMKVNYDSSKHQAKISGSITLKLVSDFFESEEYKTKQGDYSLEMKFDIKDMPYQMMWGTITTEESSVMKLNTHLPEGFESQDGWQVTRTYTGKAVYSSDGKVDQNNAVATYDKNRAFESDLTKSMIIWFSNYLWDCTK